MPVYKFKSFEEAEQALWNYEPNDEYYKKLPGLWNFAEHLCPKNYPPGIFKFRSIQEANLHREAMNER